MPAGASRRTYKSSSKIQWLVWLECSRCRRKRTPKRHIRTRMEGTYLYRECAGQRFEEKDLQLPRIAGSIPHRQGTLDQPRQRTRRFLHDTHLFFTAFG